MPTSGPGSSPLGLTGPIELAEPGRLLRLTRGERGFTLIELMVVLFIVALASGLVAVSLPDRAQGRLDEDAERLAALLESARAESRASGIEVRWEPLAPTPEASADFRFAGLPAAMQRHTRWLTPGVSAEVVGARAVLLGPEPVLPPQRIVLRLDDRRVVLATDGLAPFARAAVESAAP